MAFAAIDLGGTYVKAGLVHPAPGGASQVVRTPMPYSRSGQVADAIDVSALMQLVHRELHRLVAAGARALLISNQMHGVVLVGPDLAPVSPMYTWQADLAAHLPGGSPAVVQQLADELGDSQRRALGNELRPGLPIVTLACLAQSQGAVSEGATALSIGDFVASSLCGHVVASHVSNAAASGLYDLVTGQWSTPALHAAGVEPLAMPPVTAEPTTVGTVEANGRHVPVVCAIGDQQASLAGAGLAPDELSANVATGCQVSRRIPHADTSVPQLRPYLAGDYLATVTHIPAGRALNAFVRLLTGAHADDDLADHWQHLELAARDAPQGVQANVAVFAAARDFPGALTGLTENTMTPGAVFLGAMSDVADRIAAAASAVGTQGLSRLVFSGGLAYRSSLMREMVTHRVGLPARVVDEDADALTGLAHVATLVPHL